MAAFVGTAAVGQVPVLGLVTANTQLQYTDNTAQNTLVNRTYAWTLGASGSGLVDFGSVIKLAINAIKRSADSVESSIFLRKKIIEIGDWNMDADSVVSIAHGLPDFKKIRSLKGVIRNDLDSVCIPFDRFDYSLTADNNQDFIKFGGVAGGNISISRANAGIYDSAAYDSVGFNRGWITIEYED